MRLQLIEQCELNRSVRSTRVVSPATIVPLVAVAGFLSACAPSRPVPGATLSSYSGLTASDGMVTKSKLHVNKERVLEAKTVRIEPTTFPSTIAPKLTEQQRAVVANVVNRALCVGLSDRFTVVQPDAPADLTVRAVVTHATETDEIAAAASVAVSIGSKFVDINSPVPIPIPRVPIGLGDLSLEAEAVDAQGQQQAAMLWGKGATAFFSKPRVSKASDAYDLAAAFAEDFTYLLVKGKSPFGANSFELPSWENAWQKVEQKFNSAFGLAHKYSICETYGRSPGLFGLVGGQIGLPHEWTDKGARKAAE